MLEGTVPHRMRIATEIDRPGSYWYYEWAGGPPELVEVTGTQYVTMRVRFRGQRKESALQDLHGCFVGPVTRTSESSHLPD